MPWTCNKCSRVTSYPSQVISVFLDKLVVHVTLDSGATVSFITMTEAARLGLKIHKASQLANQADGETRMHVTGEVHETFVRGAIKFAFNALVVKKLNDATVLAGMNFLIENKICQEPHKKRVTINDKYSVEETPATFIYSSESPASLTVNLKRISVLLPDSSFEVKLPEEYIANSKVVVDSTDQANFNQTWLCQEVQAVNRSVKITNQTSKPIILGKNQDTSVLKMRPVVTKLNPNSIIEEKFSNQNNNIMDYKKVENTLTYIKRINEHHKTLKSPPTDLFIPEQPNPEEYLGKIFIEPNVMNKQQEEKLWSILRRYHKVFDNDISKGYNNASGEFDVDWNWLNDQQPPPGVSKQEVYSNDDMNQLKQDKIDWMESQNICFKAHLLGVPVKYTSLTMLVPKASFKNHKGPLSHELFRFVNLFNQLNEYIKQEPSQPESISSVLYEAGQWNFMISGDLTNSFYQRWICKRKLPYMAFHSPYKGMYVLARSAQGMKNQSEGLDQMMRVVIGDLIKQGKARKIADDVQAGGASIDEAIDNFEMVLIEFERNNIKLDPKKTKIFAKKLPIFGWIMEGQQLKPDQHSILAIEKAAKPKTITELRSYLGQYKVFYKHMPNMSTTLDQLQQLTGEKDGKQEIEWTEALTQAFDKSKEDLKNIKPLYLPKRTDQLAITLDWSGKGIGATLWALLKNKKEVVCYFSSPLKGSQARWPPCDGEGLAACAAIERFNNYIKEATHPTMICSDNKPVVQAAMLLMKGCFSTSPRLNKLLGNCNTFPIVFHHLSGKMALNTESDLLSRNPSLCQEDDCQVCQHLLEQSEVLDTPMKALNKHKVKTRHLKVESTYINNSPCSLDCQTCNYLQSLNFDQNLTIHENLEGSTKVCNIQLQDILRGHKPFPYISNRKVLIQVQKKDPVLSKLIQDLQSGSRPTSRNTKCNDLKTYLSFNPKLDYDGLVVVERVLQPHLLNLKVPILPPNFAKSVLLAAHIKLDHPKPSQFEKLVFRSFCTIKIKNLIKELFENCYTCQADLVIKMEAPEFKTESKPACPGVYWSCDVMKHGKKNIMVSTDNFSSFTICAFIVSEKQEDCEKAIISSIFPFKTVVGNVKIRVDTAPGLAAMISRNSDNFKEAGIELEQGHAKNKNSLAKVDKTMSELRSIIRTISPDGSPLSHMDLQRATESLNTRIRSSNLSAREIMFSRLQDNNKNITLDDEALSDAIFERRVEANKLASKSRKEPKIPSIKPHSLIFLKNDLAKDKSKVRDMYIVMEIDEKEKKLKIQKMLNPITNSKGEISTRNQYTVKFSDVYLAPLQKPLSHSVKLNSESNPNLVAQTSQKQSCRTPAQKDTINKFYDLEGEHSDDDLVHLDVVDDNVNRQAYEEHLRIDDHIESQSDGDSKEQVSLVETPSKDFIANRYDSRAIVSNDLVSIDQPSTGYGNCTQTIAPSPIISNEVDSDFGHLHLDWDHSSDLSTPMYDVEDDAYKLACSVAEHALDYEDDVFENDTLAEEDVDNHARVPLNLHLLGENVQRGRVYRLESKLPIPLDLHIREREIEPGKVYKLKRLSSSTKPKKSKKSKSNRKRAVNWFIKKMTFARKRPPEDDDPGPSDIPA